MPTFPYTQSREVYSIPPEGGIPVKPTGYYKVPGLPYPREPMPQTPTDPNRNRDLLGNVADVAMEPDMGVGAQPPRDPYMDSLPKAAPQDAATRAAVTRLQPSRTTPFSGRDAQALAGLDQRALEEANALADLDQPKTITGEFGGQKFEMTPSKRVDRNVLAGLYNKYQGKQAQEREDAIRSQEQAGKERIVSIPGEQATKRREMELGTEERIAGKKMEADAPARQAELAIKQAEAAAKLGAEKRAQAEAERRPSPGQEAVDRALAEAQASPFAATPAGRARIAALYKLSTEGKAIPAQQVDAAAEGAAPPAPDVGAAVSEIMSDPAIASAIEKAKSQKPGFFTGRAGRETSAASRRVIESIIRQRFAQKGIPMNEANSLITSILGPIG